MPAGYFVDGKLTYKPLVSVVTEFAGRSGFGPATKTLAVVGEFPFLESNVPYVFLSQDSFISAVPANSTMRELAAMIYAPSTVAPFAGSPGAVILVNAKPCTQASAYLKDEAEEANVLKIMPSVWGLQGNATTIQIKGGADEDLSEFTVIVANRGTTEEFKVDKGLNVLKVSYLHPTSGLIADTAYGFSDAGNGSGTLSVSKAYDEDAVKFDFTRTITQVVVKANSAGKSWIPNAPVSGVISVTKPAAVQAITAGQDLLVHVVGVGADGLPAEETLTFTDGEITGAGAVTHATAAMSSVDYVSVVNGTWVGSLVISGSGPSVGPELGHDSVAEAISYLNTFLGFSASTDSFRAGSIMVTDLDALDATSVPTSGSAGLNASRALLLQAFTLYSSLVTVEQVLDGETPVKKALKLDDDLAIVCSGGTEGLVDESTWASAFQSMRNQPVTVLFPYSTSNSVHRAALTHAKFMWGKGQREMQVVISPENDLPLPALISLRRGYADFRVTVLPHKVRVTKWNGGASDYQTKYLGLIFASMQCANTEVGLPLGGSRPNVLAFSGHSSTLGPDAADSLLANGLTPLEDIGNGITIPRWVTTFGESDDPCRTEGSAVESLAFSNIGVRNVLRPLLNQKASPEMVSKIRISVQSELDRQSNGAVIRTWLPGSLQVQETPTSYVVRYSVAPVLPVNHIAVTSVAIAFPIA
jgi:hypothetical protein